MKEDKYEFSEMADIIYDPNGPSLIGMQINVKHDGKDIETEISDIFEFLLNILLTGIVKLNLIITNNEETIKDTMKKLQFYFNKMKVKISYFIETLENIQKPAVFPQYCLINYEGKSEAIHILKIFEVVNIRKELYEYSAFYEIDKETKTVIVISFCYF